MLTLASCRLGITRAFSRGTSPTSAGPLRLRFAKQLLLGTPFVLGALSLSCDSLNPVSPTGPGPDGTDAVYAITVTAVPPSVVAGAATGSVITITIQTIEDGEVPPAGSEVLVSADLGNFGVDSAGEPIALVTLLLTDGVAQTTLFAALDEAGTATLLVAFSGETTALSLPVLAPEDAPVADFVFQATGLEVTFADLSTGNPTQFQWDFGDGSEVSTLQNPTHTYGSARTYAVSLRVTNTNASSTVNKLVEVVVAPTANFTFAFDVLEPKQVTFTDTSTGSPTSWMWNFDDCDDDPARCESIDQNPVHAYTTTTETTYTVILEATNGGGTSTKTRFVTITP